MVRQGASTARRFRRSTTGFDRAAVWDADTTVPGARERTLIRVDQCEQCRRPMVLFGFERDQLRLVCGVCAAMRTGLPDPGCSTRSDRLTPAQTAIRIYLEQIPLPRYGEGEESRQVWCPFSSETALVVLLYLIDTCCRR
jgi:hypothetical protein